MFHDCRRTAAVDMYSLGCVLIELFEERTIWPDLDSYQIQQKVCGSFQQQPAPPSIDRVPDECKDICTSCTRIEASGTTNCSSFLATTCCTAYNITLMQTLVYHENNHLCIMYCILNSNPYLTSFTNLEDYHVVGGPGSLECEVA